MPYLEIKSIIERRLAHQKRGILTTEEVTEAANEWRDYREERELDQGIIESEVRRFNEKMRHYDNNPVGSMTDNKECGKIRVFFGQLNNMSTKPIRDVKVKGIKWIEKNMI